MKLKTTIFLLMVSTITASLCFAQSEVGHGGDAVLKDGKYDLLDLVEAGIERTGKLDEDYRGCTGSPNDVDNGICHWYLSTNLESTFGKKVARGVLNALTHMPDLDAMAILKTISLFDWNFIDMPLVEIRDAQTPIDIGQYPIYQLAIRKDHTITVNSRIWNQMDPLNQAALVTHEALYAMVRPAADVRNDDFEYQDSYIARQVNYKLYQATPNCAGCSPTNIFPSVRLRDAYADENYAFSVYRSNFGDYGNADNFIGYNVNDEGSANNQRFISTGAYVKLEGVLNTDPRPGSSLIQTAIREKYIFFKQDAHHICSELFANTGTYQLKVSLVRTLFTLGLSPYLSNSGPSNFVQVITNEVSFSEWYPDHLGLGKDSVEINTDDAAQCEQTLKNTAVQFDQIMKQAPDYITRWSDGH